MAAVRDRYPALLAVPDTDSGPGVSAVVSPGGTAGGWAQMPGDGRSPAELWHLDDQITLYVMAGPGGRCLPALHTASTGVLERLPLHATIDDAPVRPMAPTEGPRGPQWTRCLPQEARSSPGWTMWSVASFCASSVMQCSLPPGFADVADDGANNSNILFRALEQEGLIEPAVDYESGPYIHGQDEDFEGSEFWLTTVRQRISEGPHRQADAPRGSRAPSRQRHRSSP